MTFRRVIWFLLATHSLLVSWIPTAFCVSRSEHDYDFHSQPLTERFKELGTLTNYIGSQFEFENPGLKRLRLEAELGSAQAQFLLGSCYSEGHGVRQDFIEALAWFTKAANQGIGEAACSIGLLYQNRGTNDDVEAAQWFEKAVSRSNEHGRFHLGMCYLLGRGVQQNNAEAMELIQEAAEKGLEEAIIMLGCSFLHGNGTKKDPAEGKRWLLKGAETGSVQAQYHLGLLHDFGLDGETNVVEALKWYRKAATNSFPKAQAELGRVLLNRGTANDFSEGIMWLRKAADQGQASALYNLAAAYYTGRGVPQSTSEAMRYCRMAVERGFVQAQEVLARLETLNYTAFGPTNITLPQGVAFQVPPNFKFLYDHAARQLLEKTGNPVPPNLVGLLTPRSMGWWFVLEFLPMGYVNDTDQAIDSEKALAFLQSEINMQGILTAWETKPSYDPHLKVLHYAIRTEAAGRKGINRCFGLLGRKGVLLVNAVYRFESIFDLAYAREIIAGIGFIPGEQHSDYKDGDKVSGAHLSKLLLDWNQGESGSQRAVEH